MGIYFITLNLDTYITICFTVSRNYQCNGIPQLDVRLTKKNGCQLNCNRKVYCHYEFLKLIERDHLDIFDMDLLYIYNSYLVLEIEFNGCSINSTSFQSWTFQSQLSFRPPNTCAFSYRLWKIVFLKWVYHHCIRGFPHIVLTILIALIKISWQKQLKEGTVYFGSQSEKSWH